MDTNLETCLDTAICSKNYENLSHPIIRIMGVTIIMVMIMVVAVMPTSSSPTVSVTGLRERRREGSLGGRRVLFLWVNREVDVRLEGWLLNEWEMARVQGRESVSYHRESVIGCRVVSCVHGLATTVEYLGVDTCFVVS